MSAICQSLDNLDWKVLKIKLNILNFSIYFKSKLPSFWYFHDFSMAIFILIKWASLTITITTWAQALKQTKSTLESESSKHPFKIKCIKTIWVMISAFYIWECVLWSLFSILYRKHTNSFSNILTEISYSEKTGIFSIFFLSWTLARFYNMTFQSISEILNYNPALLPQNVMHFWNIKSQA